MKVLVVSNMFPNKKNQSYGVFVSNFCRQLENCNIPYEKSVMHKTDNLVLKILSYVVFYINTFLKIILKKYDIIYVHYASMSSIPVLFASKFKNINIFTNVHGSDVIPENKQQKRMQFFTKKILQISEKIIVPSKYFYDVVLQKYNLPKDKIYIYPSAGVNSEVFFALSENTKKKFREKNGIGVNDFVVGYVGRLTTGKGWDTFLTACKELKRDVYKFVLIGQGYNEEKCNELIKKYGLENKVIRKSLLSQKELSKWFNIFDVFIFPTEREGESLGLVALEAMACGTPVIASDYAAPKYYIEDRINGFKFEKGNAKELAEKIEEYYLYSKEEKETLMKESLKTANLFFDNVINDQLFDIIMR